MSNPKRLDSIHCECDSMSRGDLRRAFRGGVFLFRALDPGVIGVLAHDAEGDRHVGMVLAADLRALTVIDALAIRLEPRLVIAPRHRVDARTEGLYDEG